MNFKKLVSVVCTWGVLDIMKLWRKRVERECKIYMVKPNTKCSERGRVSMIYSIKVGPKKFAMVRFHVKNK